MRIKNRSLFRKFPCFAAAQSGVAAIEFAFILPFMLLLYFGLLDLTGLISVNRKMTSTASVVADLTGQGGPITRNLILKADIADYMNVSDIINKPMPPSGVAVRVLGYRSTGPSSVNKIWETTKAGGPACTVPSTTGMNDLMTAGNDIIVAQACTVFVPYVTTFLGQAVIGKTSYNVQQDVMLRPRSTLQLNCSNC